MTDVRTAAVWVLAPAWGALLASPLLLAARRAWVRGRAGELSPPPERRERRWRVPGPLGAVLRGWRVRGARRREQAELERELPLTVDLVQVAVSAGATPRRAVELAVAWGPPTVGRSLASAVDATRLGGALADALDHLAQAIPALTPLTDVLVASDRLGAPAAPALTRLAGELRADLRRRAEARARTLPVKLLFPLVFLVLPAFGLLTVVPALLQALART
jgi:pilus assembly protein TadC